MFFVPAEIDRVRLSYGLDIADLDGDGAPVVLCGSTGEHSLRAYRAPAWEPRVITAAFTGLIGVAAHDIDGDGRTDIALASGFLPGIRSAGARLHWLRQPDRPGGGWADHPIDSIPYLHRIAWADVDGDGRKELLAAAICGPSGPHREGGGPLDWSDPGWIGFYRVPADPANEPWPLTVLDGHLRTNHGLATARLTPSEAAEDVLVGAAEGLFRYEFLGGNAWERHRISASETSEVAALYGPGGAVLGLAAVEPWHGNRLVVYHAPADLAAPDWPRTEIDDSLAGGHSLACADLDGDGLPEIVTGSFRPGTDLRFYRAHDASLRHWERTVIDDAIGPGQTLIADLDGDGRLEIVASGLSTGNLRVYRRVP
jgi:hypothetical protein